MDDNVFARREFADLWLKRLCAAGAALFVLSLVWLDVARNYKPTKEWRTTLATKPVEMSPDGVLYYLGGAADDAVDSAPVPSYAIATYSGLILIDPLLDHQALSQTLDNFNLSASAIRAIVLMNDAPARRAAALQLAKRTGAQIHALADGNSKMDAEKNGEAAALNIERASTMESNYRCVEVEDQRSEAAIQPLRDGEVIHVGDARLYIMAPRGGESRKACLFACILRRNILFAGDLLDELLDNGGRSQPELSKRIAAGPIDLMLPNAPWPGDEFDAELAARQYQERKSSLAAEAEEPNWELGRRAEHGSQRSEAPKHRIKRALRVTEA